MRRLLQRLCNSRLRSLECMVYAMSLFVIFGVFYSLGQLHLQQQFYRGLGPSDHQIPEGRKVLAFFKRSSGNSEEDSSESRYVGRYGWRDKPYAISQEHWKSLLQNDNLEDGGSNASEDRGALLDEIDGYNAFVSFEDIKEDKKTAQRSQRNSQRSSLNDLIHPQEAAQSQVHDQGQGYVGQPSINGFQANTQNSEDRPLSATSKPGIEVHESFLVHKIRPKDSSHEAPNKDQHQRDNAGANILHSEVEVGLSANGREIKDSEIDLPWLAEAKDPVIKHAGFAKQAKLVPHNVNAREEANSVNTVANPGQAQQRQQQPQADKMSGSQKHNKGYPQQSNTQYDKDGSTDKKILRRIVPNNGQHRDNQQQHVGNQGNSWQWQQQRKQYHGNGAAQQQAGGYNHDKHEVIKRDVTGIRQHPDGSVAKDDKATASASAAAAGTDAGSYGRKGVVMESRQMPSWQVLAKIEQDLEAEGHKMQMEMLRYVMHNGTKDGSHSQPHSSGLQVNRPSNNGQRVVIVPQSSPYQGNSGANNQYNEILKQKLLKMNTQGQNVNDPNGQLMNPNQGPIKPKLSATGVNQRYKTNKTRSQSSHHHHHHHHHHPKNFQHEVEGNKAVPVVNYAEDIPAKAMASNGQVDKKFVRNENISKSYAPDIQFDQNLLAQQPRIYMALLGRMGNHLFHLASLYGIARKTQHTPVVSPGAYILEAFDSRIKDVFVVDEPPNNIPTIHEEGSGVYTAKVYQLPQNTDIQLCCYFQSWRYFVEYSDELRQIFTFKPWITARAQAILSMAKRDYMTMQFGQQLPRHISHTVTYVGVHVRRSDHLLTEHLKKGYKPASLSYFNKAMDFYRQKYANVYFIVCSDEIEWAKDHLRDKDVYFVEGQDGLVDLGVLAACNHTVTSVGTFSWWAGWLAGGEVTYYSDWPIPGTEIDKNYKHYDYFMPHWKPFGD